MPWQLAYHPTGHRKVVGPDLLQKMTGLLPFFAWSDESLAPLQELARGLSNARLAMGASEWDIRHWCTTLHVNVDALGVEDRGCDLYLLEEAKQLGRRGQQQQQQQQQQQHAGSLLPVPVPVRHNLVAMFNPILHRPADGPHYRCLDDVVKGEILRVLNEAMRQELTRRNRVGDGTFRILAFGLAAGVVFTVGSVVLLSVLVLLLRWPCHYSSSPGFEAPPPPQVDARSKGHLADELADRVLARVVERLWNVDQPGSRTMYIEE
jgi:hypothetical protein